MNIGKTQAPTHQLARQPDERMKDAAAKRARAEDTTPKEARAQNKAAIGSEGIKPSSYKPLGDTVKP